MGKTLGAIITIGAAIAINVIPGAGQAISGTIFGGLSAVTGTVGTLASAAFTISQIAPVALTLAGLSSIQGLLFSPKIPKPDTASTGIRTPIPPRVSAYGETRLYGACVLYETSSNGTAIDVWAVHDGPMSQMLQLYLADDKVSVSGGYPGGFVQPGEDGRYGDNKVRLYYTDGRVPGTSIDQVVSELPGIWTNNHRGDGACLLYLMSSPVKSDDYLDIYPNGVPTPSVVAQWQKCPNPFSDDPTDPSQWTYTENVVRHIMHYKMVREGVDYATKIAPTLDYWKAASLVCDEAVPLKAGGSEPRWRSCLSHEHTRRHGDVVSTMLAACDGWMATRQDGAFVIYAGKYYTPTVTIGPEHIVSYDWKGVGVDDDEAVNELICSYVSKDHDYNSVETTAWRDENDISKRGQRLSNTLEIQTPSWGQVRRLAKRQMARANALYRGTVTTNVSGRIARGERYINLHLEEAGVVFYTGPVEITAVTRNMATGGLTFTWSQVDPNIDAWNPVTEEGDPAPVGERVASEPLATPSITSASAEIQGGTTARVRIIVNGFDRDDYTWYARWRVSGDVTWNEQSYTDLDPGTPVELLTSVVPINQDVEVEVSYSSGDGRTSPWSDLVTVDTTA